MEKSFRWFPSGTKMNAISSSIERMLWGAYIQRVILTIDRLPVSMICSIFYMFLKDIKKQSHAVGFTEKIGYS